VKGNVKGASFDLGSMAVCLLEGARECPPLNGAELRGVRVGPRHAGVCVAGAGFP
jgi:hypothetical protein